MTRPETKNYDRFVCLARYFIDSYNPKPTNFPALLDCILSVPDDLIPLEPCGRYFAHSFCRAAFAAIAGEEPASWISIKEVSDWLKEWVATNVS